MARTRSAIARLLFSVTQQPSNSFVTGLGVSCALPSISLLQAPACRWFATAARGPSTPKRGPPGVRPHSEGQSWPSSKANITDFEHSERLFPQKRSQRVFAARVERALVAVLHEDLHLRQTLVEPFGLSVHAVRVSPDRRHAAVLWDCRRTPPRLADACRAALGRHGGRLRGQLATALGAAFVPALDWRHAALDGEERHAVGVLEAIAMEAEATAEAEAKRGR